MGTEANKDDRSTPEYLAQLLKDKKQIQALPNVFVHVEKLLDEEINRVRISLFHHKTNREPLDLPQNEGAAVTLSEKIYVPSKEHPEFNFVGRILGPRGMTAKELEQYTGCKVMVRGKGSMRDKKKEEQNRGKANWEHLNEELHVLITVEDTKKRAELKLQKAIEEVKKLLVPAPEGEDELKKKQLMELAILNGTYRNDQTCKMLSIPGLHHLPQAPRFMGPHLTVQQAAQFRTGNPTGAPIILAPRMPNIATSTAGMMNGQPPPLISPSEGGLMYNPYDYPFAYAPAAHAILEYPTGLEQAGAGAVPKIRRTLAGMREHPYTRVTTLP